MGKITQTRIAESSNNSAILKCYRTKTGHHRKAPYKEVTKFNPYSTTANNNGIGTVLKCKDKTFNREKFI